MRKYLAYYRIGIISASMYPSDIYTVAASVIATFIIPIAFIATFPAKALLGKIDLAQIVLAIILTLAFVFLSQWFWSFALKRYSSASS